MVSIKQGVHVQAFNWKATVSINIIDCCWTSYHKPKLLVPSALMVSRQGMGLHPGDEGLLGEEYTETLVLMRV